MISSLPKTGGKNLKKIEKKVTVAIRSIGLSLTVSQGKHRIPVSLGIGNTRTMGVDCLVFECSPGEYEVKDNGPGRKVYSGTLIVEKGGKVKTRGWRLMNHPTILQGNP